jgi:glyoxalase family protein
LSFEDPDGLPLTLIIPETKDNRAGWQTDEVKGDVAIKGFHSITLTLKNASATAKILTDIFNYKLVTQEGRRYRYATNEIETASIVDIVEEPGTAQAVNAGGTIHHVAFRVKDEQTLMAFREKVLAFGLGITEKIDRNYFFSLYFREPGGVLFEIATDNPGFAVDEPVDKLGSGLKLPPQYESYRNRIEAHLPVIN